jgi:hypothetical protein
LLLALASTFITGLTTIFYCLRFETSLFVIFYNKQGYGGSIWTCLHTGGHILAEKEAMVALCFHF